MAKQESLRTSECPVARTLESIGERFMPDDYPRSI